MSLVYNLPTYESVYLIVCEVVVGCEECSHREKSGECDGNREGDAQNPFQVVDVVPFVALERRPGTGEPAIPGSLVTRKSRGTGQVHVGVAAKQVEFGERSQ